MNKERSYDHNGSHNKMSYTVTERKEIEDALTNILYAKEVKEKGIKAVKESLRNSPERVNGVFTKTIRLKEILEMNLIFDERFQRPFGVNPTKVNLSKVPLKACLVVWQYFQLVNLEIKSILFLRLIL